MCFSENLSYLNFVILTSYGSYIIQSWRLSLPLLYLGLKDLLQGLLYKYLDNSSISTILGTLSYIHICFQPLIFNMAFSYFDTNKNKKLYWNFIFYGNYQNMSILIFNMKIIAQIQNLTFVVCIMADIKGNIILAIKQQLKRQYFHIHCFCFYHHYLHESFHSVLFYWDS